MTYKEKLLLFVLASVNFTHIMDFMIMMPMGPQLMDIFDISPRQFGFVVSSYSLSAGISGFLAAFFVDRFDRKKVLLFAYIGFTIGTFACAFAPTYFLLCAARVLAGLFGGMIGSQVLSIVADTFSYERRASAMGSVMMAFSLASVIGVPAGLYLANHFSWHAPFLVVGGLGVLVIFMIIRFVPILDGHLKGNAESKNPIHVITDIAKNSNQMRALGLSVIIMLGHFSIIPFISPSLVGNAGFSQENIYLIYLVGGAVTIVTAPIVGKIADKKGKYPVFVVFALLSLIPIWLITNLFVVPLYVILVISAIFFIFSNGRLIPTQAMVSSVVTPQQRGGFMAINSSVQLLAQAIATNIGGLIIHKTASGYIENYHFVGYFAIFMIAISIFVAKSVKQVQ
ncbi:MAG: MFS transporter [Spirosomaceae bacterium]|jgi:predicted MFS family arabinose efflux permease|nr:MFS transporter [Spirosomataceae bacterium]